MFNINDRLLADFACVDPTYVDEVGAVLNLGANFNMLFYRWTPVSAQDGRVQLEPTPAISLILPRTSVLARSGIVATWLQALTAPGECQPPRPN